MSLEFPADLLYCQSHEWIRRRDDGALVIGITDFAQEELGDVVYVDFPQPGTKVEQGQPLCSLESVKAVSDVYAPVSGEILEVNQALDADPGQLNLSAYGDGWLMVFKPAAPFQADAPELLSAEAYRQQVAG